MKYILTAAWDDGVADLTQRLVKELAADKKVLWLLSGGSNVPSSVQIMDNISAEQSENLTVSLIDERYGKLGHAESNWEQLLQAGFKGKQATLVPILEADTSFEQTIKNYNEHITQLFAGSDAIIAQLGIGSDGHIAGILPHSPATTATDLVTGYESPPLTRLTLTFPALKQVTAAYVFAFGQPKQQALLSLRDKTASLEEEPAQILHELHEAYLYSDQVGKHV